ncbi:putative ribonuclease H-like domain-containing protein, partial [Tanacetum coccineum]
IDVKSAFLYGTIEEEVYVCQPPGFEDRQFLDKVYKVEKSLHGLHQAPKAWYETLSTYLIENGFRRGTIDKTKRINGYSITNFNISNIDPKDKLKTSEIDLVEEILEKEKERSDFKGRFNWQNSLKKEKEILAVKSRAPHQNKPPIQLVENNLYDDLSKNMGVTNTERSSEARRDAVEYEKEKEELRLRLKINSNVTVEGEVEPYQTISLL